MATFWTSAAAVGIGASLGAILRWQLSLWLNRSTWSISMGTLVANWLGAYLVGIAMAWIGSDPRIPDHWKLFIITGFLGGLTTFSTFSAELVHLLQENRLMTAAMQTLAHVAGSVIFTLIGIASFGAFRELHTLKS
jgi:CrcB protein